MIGKGVEGCIVENIGCRMSNREPLKVTEQRKDADKASLLVGQWKMV